MPVPASLARLKLTGVCPPARGAVIAELMRGHPAPVWLVVAENLKLAEQLAEDIAFFYRSAGGNPAAVTTLLFPESIPDSRDMREAFAASADRTTVLSRLRASRSAELGARSWELGAKSLEPGAKSLEPGARSSEPGARSLELRAKSLEPGARSSELAAHSSQLIAPSSQLIAPSSQLVIVTTPAALIQPVPAIEAFANRELTLTRGQTQPFQALLETLHGLDYDSEAVCESPGHYAVRGGIIDVYPITATDPYRLDFFGDEIEDIRAFDPVTQRSGEQVQSITLSASPRLKLDASKTGLADYLSPLTQLVFIEPAILDAEFAGFADEGFDGLTPILKKSAAAFGLADIDEAAALFDGEEVSETTWDTESLVHHRSYPSDELVAQERLCAEEEARRNFLQQLVAWKKDGYGLAFVVSKEGEEQRVKEILAEDSRFKGLQPLWVRGTLNEGFRCTYRAGAGLLWSTLPKRKLGEIGGLVLVTETELFGRQRTRRVNGPQRAQVNRAQVDQLLDFSELVEGDFVVHLQHGIALYRGLTKLEMRDGLREVISLEFDDGVTLHVPLQESHLISRYVGLGKTKPQLGKVGSGRWEKTRQAAERATIDLAADLLKIQAQREAQPGHPCLPDNDWQKEFEGSFPFTETKDQLKAIEETKADMERARPMDRLICGDVGFGKTEVAIRAAFKAVQDGRQVAILVPTTILAQQHLNTFRERMAGYPIAVEMVSRFRTKAESTRILAATAVGQVDILIGTHRILGADVAFKNLGLVIVDEEQRFGVKHKERLKSMRSTVDILSMSATPIPRTLYMAMTGARDMSVIETPPVNRHPIQTIVKTYDDKLVVEAVRHELRRGGQVFYLHNRVQTINLVAARLTELMPDITVGVGHGQMDEHDLERVMTEFVAGKYQVLVCTTIIETGLDIPNCNTIIIEGADRFGLSQLYQLRGRVGRFKHQAYAYLLLHRHTRLVEITRERLNALRTHNQLGAGFRIAMRDLELRGAGNLLGSQQSGHIIGVGFELYCQLLRQSVARLKGEKNASAIRAAVKLDFVFVGESALPTSGPASASGPSPAAARTSYQAIKFAEQADDGAVEVSKIQARIPSVYIAETRLRIDFYRRLAMAGSGAQLKEIESDLRDRFGPFGDEVRALLLITDIRIRAESKRIITVETESSRLKCARGSGVRDDFVMVGARFPRLTAPKALARMKEIITFLNNLPSP